MDHDALVVALRSGQLAGAGLDVYWDEPIDPADPILQENVLATAHIGGVTEQALPRYRAEVRGQHRTATPQRAVAGPDGMIGSSAAASTGGTGSGLGVPLGQDHREHEDLHRDG